MKKISLVLAFLTLLAPDLWSQGTFTEVASSAGIQQKVFNRAEMAGGSAWFDYDQDGDEDLVLVGGETGNLLYQNQGNGTFSDVTVAAGFYIPDNYSTQAVVTGDIDNDGFREIFATTWWNEPNYLFYNNGDGTFTDISAASGLGFDSIWTTTSTFVDFNLDGMLDLYTGNYVDTPIVIYDSIWNPVGYAHRCHPNQLWFNNGDLTFSDVTSVFEVGDTGCALSVLLSDFDRDHDPDTWTANDFGEWVSGNNLFQNNFPSASSNVTAAKGVQAEMYGMGFAHADCDHDLDFDYYITNIGANRFFENQNGIFTDRAVPLSVVNDSINGAMTTGWGTFFLDWNNDSWQDLFVANGHIQLIPIFENQRQDPDRLWENNGNGTFTEVSMAIGLGDTNQGRGASVCDYDLDGDQDIWVSVVSRDTLNLPDRSLLFRNDLNNGHHWVQVRVEGTRNNRDGYGTQMVVKANGTKWLHEVVSGGSHYSQSSSIAHFGMGNATTLDSLTVIWPDGNAQVFTNLAVDSLYHIVEDSSQYVATLTPKQLRFQVYPNPFSDHVSIECLPVGSSPLQLRIYDLNGKVVFQDEADNNGRQIRFLWDGTDPMGRTLPVGNYVAVLNQQTMRTSRVLQKIR